MKFFKIYFLLLLSILSSSFAQVHLIKYEPDNTGFSLDLSFKDEPYLLQGEKGNVINFVNALEEDKPGYPSLPSKTIFIAIPPSSKIQLKILNEKFNFINDVFPKINPQIELKEDSSLTYVDAEISSDFKDIGHYPQEKYSIRGYTWIRDYYCAVVRINTHIYDLQTRRINALKEAYISVQVYDEQPFSNNSSLTGEFDSMLKELIINYKEAQNYRSFAPTFNTDDSTGNWIDYNKEYVKLRIPDDGIYRIGYDELLSYGINPQNIDPKTIKIFSKGNEIPLFVFGENDNTFDQGDYIEFWAKKNYGSQDYRNLVSSGEDYLPYFDIYSDTAIVWLTWDGNNGVRVEVMNNYIYGLTDSVTSHLVKIHLEKDNLFWYYGFELPRIQLPFWHECKTWVWRQASSTGQASFSFEAKSFVHNTNVNTISRLNSWYSDGVRINAHKYGAKLNSSDIQDSIVFDFETIANLEAVFNSNELSEGTNNYRIRGMPNDEGKLNKVVVDWIDIEYNQYAYALNDSLLIRIPDSVVTQPRVIKVSNILSNSDSIIIYKIGKENKKFTSFTIDSNELTYTDTVKGGDEYVISNVSYLRQPLFLERKTFANLRVADKQADYIIISNKALQQSVTDYANFIESYYSGITVETIYVNDIYDEFGYGYLRPEPIKEFLIYANSNWFSPKPSYLVLIGDCTYDFKDLFTTVPSPRKQILVPSFGQPVSDSWYTMWDTTNINVQQMLVGRIPANNNVEVYRYLNKHEKYVQREFDEWNKHFMLLSGGFPDDPSGMEQIRLTNEGVLNNIITPPPVGGEATHFYKTIDPPTNFGPYTADEIQQALDYGGLFISYVGHSGTRIWDNGITEPSDINNAFDDRLPVVTDNGCSTGKFAEPDIDAFGELFVNQDPLGQAIVYTGNSSLGYTSTAYRLPELFYKRLLVDTTLSIGEAHFLSKMDNFNLTGFGDVNRVYNYCNIFFGDPIIKFAFPDKPNFVVNPNSVKFNEDFITDIMDSVNVIINVSNWGKVAGDSLQIIIKSTYLDSTIYNINLLVPSPLFHDTLNLNIPLLGLAGEHKLEIELDKDNLIYETNENDNSVVISFIVYSTKIRPIESELFYNSSRNFLKVLNPIVETNGQLNELEFALSENSDFSTQSLFTTNLDTVTTIYPLNNPVPDKRYYWRARLSNVNQEWSQTVSFYNNSDYSWLLNHSFNQPDISLHQVEFDSLTLGWEIKQSDNSLKIASAGFNDGSYASVQYNYLEYLPVTFFRGIATAQIDTFDLMPFDISIFDYYAGAGKDSMINYLNTLDNGSILAFAGSDEFSVYFNGTSGDSLKQLLKGFGSVYVDSIGWRDSWAMIGIKGAPQGSVREVFSKSLHGPAIIDSSKFVQFADGTIKFPVVENSSKWLKVIKKDSIPTGASINYYPLGYRSDGTVDTLEMLLFDSDEASLESINVNTYKKISIFANLFANSELESPQLKEIGINFIPLPELAINYQVVTTTADSVLIGEDVGLNFSVYNVGESTADSFKVKVEVIGDDNFRITISEQMIDSLSANNREDFELSYNTSSGTGSKTFMITIDSDNNVRELFEDNNFYSVPFYIKPDTSRPSLKITFDGNDIIDGDYISPTPEIRIELTDETLLPLTDTSAVTIFLNNEPVYYATNQSILSINFNQENPKAILTYKPVLKDGKYYLRAFGKNSLGSVADSSGLEKHFLVSNEAQMLYVYNYPNPTKGETYFTFRLTRIPEEIKIKIYTIAGRLIKEIVTPGSNLNYDFNKIYWNGRDEDGNEIANGVYLYKVILSTGDKTQDVIQKLAIVK